MAFSITSLLTNQEQEGGGRRDKSYSVCLYNAKAHLSVENRKEGEGELEGVM